MEVKNYFANRTSDALLYPNPTNPYENNHH